MEESGFRAIAYHPSLPEGQASGRLSLDDNDIAFSWEGGKVRASWENVILELTGFNRSQAVLTHPQLLDWKFVVADPAALSHPALARHPMMGKVARKGAAKSRRMPWPLKFLLVLIVGGLALLGLVIWQFNHLVRSAAEKIPIETEEAFGKALEQQFLATTQAVDDPKLKEKLEAVTSRLLPQVAGSGYTFRFHIVKDKALNAFAIPGGYVFVHSGLIEASDRPEQLAGVLAHEMAHVTERHSLRNFIKSAGLGVALSILFGGDLTGSTAANGSQWLLEQKFSRDFEREADETGHATLVRAGIDPQGMREFFLKMKEEEAKHAGAPPAWASTHPATQERIDRLKDLDKTLPADFHPEPMTWTSSSGELLKGR